VTLREEVRRLAENATLAIDPTETTIAVAYMDRIESAIHAAIKLVLEREPSVQVLHEIWERADSDIYFVRRKQCYRAMNAQLLKELEAKP
jgi:hypothetical protein